MTAIQALHDQLREVQYKQSFLVDDDGVVYSYARYEYQQLSVKAADIRKGIALLEEIKQEKQEALTRRKG